jgi:biopolymer transport protein ExbB
MRIFQILLLVSISLFASDPFDELLKETIEHSKKDLSENRKRLKIFQESRNEARKLLRNTERKRDEAIKHSKILNKTIDSNEQKISKKEEELQRQVGDLGELFGVIRQISGETKVDFENSITSLHYPERGNFLEELSQSKELPNIEKLEKMWLIMLEEMIESSKISKFSTEIIQQDGTSKTQEVITIGSYGAVSEGEFLIYSPTEKGFLKLAKQPPSYFTQTATNFDNTETSFVQIAIDPTRGQLLNMLTQKPDFSERLEQGGIIGKIIIALGIIGLILAIGRYIYLSWSMRILKKQSKDLSNPNERNALGRIAKIYNEHKEDSQEKRTVVVEEAILKEIPQFEKYNSFVKLLAGVSPLLGLLGTVTGMIITFQAITLFGTSDPKLMAGGISTALITTVLGISVAIPLLFAYTFISSKTKQIIDLLEHQSIGLIAMDNKK